MQIPFYLYLGVAVIVIAYSISLYNMLSRKRNQIQNALSSLDALFMQRADLLPNLVVAVQHYMVFEKETLEKITALRQAPVTTSANNPYLKPEEGSSMLRQIMIQAENYPDLKAGEQFSRLQRSFNECEEQIAAGRRFLSAAITDYNTSTLIFPANAVAKAFGFEAYKWHYASPEQRRKIEANDVFNQHQS